KGSTLPSTGGIGTTIFYVLGGTLVVGSGIALVTKKRLGKNED
ncbi:MAG: LPXTG cell wall anchor domain-containing protein, partial [Ruminococcus sp.]|nr:LPXTG cell wall anchor domain-containing protein [Ruminococcus sp.]